MDGTTAGQIPLTPPTPLPPPTPAMPGVLPVAPINPAPVSIPQPVINMAQPAPYVEPVMPNMLVIPPTPLANQPQYAPPAIAAVQPMPTPAAVPVPVQPVIPAGELGLSPPESVTQEQHLQRVENQIADIDLDRMAGNSQQVINTNPAQPTVPLPPPPVAQPVIQAPIVPMPVAPAATAAGSNPMSNYFKTGSSIVSDVPISEPKSPLGGMDPRLIRRILIIIGIVIALGVGGYFIVNAINGNQQPQTQPVTTPETPQDPVVTEPTPEPTEPVVTETPVVTPPPTEAPIVTPDPIPPTPTPAPAPPTPAVTETIPTVPNSGIR